MKLGDYIGRKVTEPDFRKKFLIWRYSQRGLQISPKSDTNIFLKNSFNDVFGFWPEVSAKFNLQFEWNQFFRKIFSLEGHIWPRKSQKVAQIEVFGYFLDFVSLVFLNFAHNDRWAWCLVVFLQFAGPVNVFLFFIR